MCPACLATAAWAVAGTTSAGGLSVFIARRWRSGKQRRARADEPPKSALPHDERKRP